MERYEIGGDERLAAMVAAAARGEEAVFTQDGEVVASVEPRGARAPADDGAAPQRGIDWVKLRAVHDAIPAGMRGGGAALIREMRDMDEH